MSQIITEFIRVEARPDAPIDNAEAQRIVDVVVNTRGSFWVPITAWVADDGSRMEVQIGGGRNFDVNDLWLYHADRYAAIWHRAYNDAGGFDHISRVGWGVPDCEDSQRWCRYAFDEVRVRGSADHLPSIPPAGPDAPEHPNGPSGPDLGWIPQGEGEWLLSVNGIYLAGNDRCDKDADARTVDWHPPQRLLQPGGLATPTSPCYDWVEFEALYPAELMELTCQGNSPTRAPAGLERVEYLWRGRVVHRAQEEPDYFGEPDWDQRSADDWDNCADPAYLAAHRPAG